MNKLITEDIQTSGQFIMNCAYAHGGEVWLHAANDGFDITLASYIANKAKVLGCDITREDVLKGDSCGIDCDCDCPLWVLNVVAIQAAELRERLRSYEEGE